MNGMDQKVSIIMPAYNSALFIGETIESVLDQTHTDWELIVIDDGSTDETVAVVNNYQDERIRLLKCERNCGAALARNYGLREAKGKWVAFLDSDDRWLPEKLEKQIAFMEKNGYSFSYTDYRVVDLQGKNLPYIYTAPNKITKFRMNLYCWFSTITVMYDREKIGLIQIADLKKNNDYAMWFAISEYATAYRLPECLSVCYKRENSISSGSKWKLIRHHYILHREALGKNPVSAMLRTSVNLFFGVVRKLVFKKCISKNKGT